MVLALYLLGVVVAFYPLVHTLVHTVASRERDGVDWGFATVIGAILSAGWPLILVGVGAFLVSKRIWSGSWSLPWKAPIRETANGR